MNHKVTVAAVAVTVRNRVHLQRRGTLLPQGVSDAEVARLLRKGFIVAVEPKGDAQKAVEKMTQKELVAYAAAQGIDLDGAKSKAEILAKVQTPAAPVAGTGDDTNPAGGAQGDGSDTATGDN